MDDELDLKGFSGRARLFPLPGVAMFPHVVAPLHIFEPRYRRMTEDALEGDRLIATVRLVPPGPAPPRGPSPEVAEVACLGRIVHHERLADGRFNILLLGLRRARILREPRDADLPYRTADLALIEERPPREDEAAGREALAGRLREAFGAAGGADAEFLRMLDSAASLAALTDVIAHALPFPAEFKQALLGEPSADARARLLGRRIADLAPGAASPLPRKKTFPPPFSDN